MATDPSLARDSRKRDMQLAHMTTSKYATIDTTPVQFDTVSDRVIKLTNTSAVAIFYRVEAASTAAVANQGDVVSAGSSYVTKIYKGEWIGSTADLHCCAVGDAE